MLPIPFLRQLIAFYGDQMQMVVPSFLEQSMSAFAKEQERFRERAQPYIDDPQLVRSIMADGCDRARKLAQETMRDVREVMGLSYD